MVDPTGLKPYPGNPNTHPDEQLRLLTRAITERGWRHPIIISKLSGCIVAGHARQTVAIAMQLPTVPVDYQEFDSAAKEREFVLADNRMAELAEMDNEALKGMIASLADDPNALEVAGYTAAMVAILSTPSTIDRPSGDAAGASPWDRVGDAAEGVMFSFGAIQKRVPVTLFEAFAGVVSVDNLEDWINEAINR